MSGKSSDMAEGKGIFGCVELLMSGGKCTLSYCPESAPEGLQ